MDRPGEAVGRRGAGRGSVASSAADELSYLREFEHVTLAEAAPGAGRRGTVPTTAIGEATELLERLLAAAEDGGRSGSVIEILVLQALAHQARGDVAGALASLERAVALAEPEGYVRVFVDEGPPMAALLKLAAKRAERSGLRPPTPGRRCHGRGTSDRRHSR